MPQSSWGGSSRRSGSPRAGLRGQILQSRTPGSDLAITFNVVLASRTSARLGSRCNSARRSALRFPAWCKRRLGRHEPSLRGEGGRCVPSARETAQGDGVAHGGLRAVYPMAGCLAQNARQRPRCRGISWWRSPSQMLGWPTPWATKAQYWARARPRSAPNCPRIQSVSRASNLSRDNLGGDGEKLPGHTTT